MTDGSILFKNKDLCRLSDKEMRGIRGADISMIFQDPMTALNPTLTVGDQLGEALLRHKKMSKKAARKEVLSMLSLVGIPDPEERLKQYPHQFSGGMRQRIVIAMALICEPDILIADEPTTALDVTIQAQILELFKEIQRKTNVSVILITHDLGVVAQVADRVAVMYAGKMAEIGTRKDIFYQPQHPYTKGLLASVPRLDLDGAELIPIDGTPPDLFSPPPGCPFAARCPNRMVVCDRVYPARRSDLTRTPSTAGCRINEQSMRCCQEMRRIEHEKGEEDETSEKAMGHGSCIRTFVCADGVHSK